MRHNHRRQFAWKGGGNSFRDQPRVDEGVTDGTIPAFRAAPLGQEASHVVVAVWSVVPPLVTVSPTRHTVRTTILRHRRRAYRERAE